MGAPNVLDVRAMSKHYSAIHALRDINFSVVQGEIVVLIGKSGSGKSTLLRCIQMLEDIDKGTIGYWSKYLLTSWPDSEPTLQKIDAAALEQASVPASEIRKSIGFVAQNYELWDEKTVLENLVLAPVVILKEERAQVAHRAEELCIKFGLREKISTRAWQLSGGQRQRVAIVRALMMQPRLLLFDEVTASLDPLLTYEMMGILRELKEAGMTMLVVTHHLRFGLNLAERIVFMHDGSIVQDCPPSTLVASPASAEVEQFLTLLDSLG